MSEQTITVDTAEEFQGRNRFQRALDAQFSEDLCAVARMTLAAIQDATLDAQTDKYVTPSTDVAVVLLIERLARLVDFTMLSPEQYVELVRLGQYMAHEDESE